MKKIRGHSKTTHRLRGEGGQGFELIAIYNRFIFLRTSNTRRSEKNFGIKKSNEFLLEKIMVYK